MLMARAFPEILIYLWVCDLVFDRFQSFPDSNALPRMKALLWARLAPASQSVSSPQLVSSSRTSASENPGLAALIRPFL